MRIALLTDTYSDDVNGVARTLARLVAHAAECGHEIVLVTPRVSPDGDPDASRHLQLPGIPVPMYPELQLARPLGRRERRLLDDFRPEVVHIATESTIGLSALFWARRRGVPVVTSFHTNFPAYLHSYRLGALEPLIWRYLRWFHSRSHATLCPSEDTLKHLRAQGFHDRLRVWSRGVDADLYSPARRRTETRERLAPDADRILLYVGRLAGEKRVDFLLDAYLRVRERTRGVALVFVGDGPAGEALRRRAPADVHFTGYLTGVELAEAYAAGDVFVFASDTETFGNVVLEALSSGLPAIVVDKGGVRATVHEGRTGIRVPVGDVEAFADACVRLLSDEEERAALAAGARSEAEARDWASILDGVLHTYESALRGRTRPVSTLSEGPR